MLNGTAVVATLKAYCRDQIKSYGDDYDHDISKNNYQDASLDLGNIAAYKDIYNKLIKMEKKL